MQITKDGAVVPVSTLSQISVREREIFLRVVQESLAVDSHLQLYLWLRGTFQHLLPHEALIVIAPMLAAHHARADIVSGLPGVRTYGCVKCSQQLVSEQVFERWRHNDRQVLAVEGPVDELFSWDCDCRSALTLKGMGSALVHGLRDERSGGDILYVALAAQRGIGERRCALFAMLLPVVDFACRRVTPLAIASREVGVLEGNLAEFREDAGISSREQEILSWVRAGKTNYEIGQILNISAFTVKNHLQRIYRKIDVINRAQAVAKIEEYVRSR